MNRSDSSSIDVLLSDVRANTNLDAQEYEDFFISVFFIFFVLASRRDVVPIPSFYFSELKKISECDDFFAKLLIVAGHIDLFYQDDLGLAENINRLISRAEDLSVAFFRQACISLYELVSRNETLPGVVFEEIIQFFSEARGKRGGDAYTPRELVNMMVEIVEPRGGESVYDPACGSGGFLISANAKASNSESDLPLTIYGREINPSAARIARMNCIVHGVVGGSIRVSDSLKDLEFSAYDVVIGNPPFSLAIANEKGAPQSYFDFGTPPSSNADFAFLQMILKSLKPGGRAAVLVSNGVLFRGGAEGAIRKNIIKAGLIEAVIALPGGTLKNTGIPTAILVLKNLPLPDRSILLIDSTEAERHISADLPASNRAPFRLTLETYRKFQEVEGVSKLVTAAELESNSYSLNISRYILARQVQKKSLSELVRNQRELEARLVKLQSEFSHFLAEHDMSIR